MTGSKCWEHIQWDTEIYRLRVQLFLYIYVVVTTDPDFQFFLESSLNAGIDSYANKVAYDWPSLARDVDTHRWCVMSNELDECDSTSEETQMKE